MTEVEVEGVGTYRLPNDWQYVRLRRLRGERHHTALLAFGCGMTVRQFAKLPLDRQQAVHRPISCWPFHQSPSDPSRSTTTLRDVSRAKSSRRATCFHPLANQTLGSSMVQVPIEAPVLRERAFRSSTVTNTSSLGRMSRVASEISQLCSSPAPQRRSEEVDRRSCASIEPPEFEPQGSRGSKNLSRLLQAHVAR